MCYNYSISLNAYTPEPGSSGPLNSEGLDLIKI